MNHLPSVGTYLKKEHPGFNEDAQVTGSFIWLQAVTAGFKEPCAVSVFLGNVVDFSIPREKTSKGIGYSGLLCSEGTYHIKNNTLIRDDWWELKWKVNATGERRTRN